MLWHVSISESSSVVAVGLRMKPLQLVVATNDQIPCKTLIEHLTTICSTLKKLSDTKFSYSFPDTNLREVSPELDLEDGKLQALYDNFFLQLYKYGYERLKTKHVKRWNVFEDFRRQYSGWIERITQHQGTRCDQIEPHKTFFSDIGLFRVFNLRLQDCLSKFYRYGWKMDKNEMEILRLRWHQILTRAESILDLVVEGNSEACDYWAKKVDPNGKLHVSDHKIDLVMT